VTNELEVGQLRTGTLVDRDTSTPEVQVLLERTDSRICLTISWSSPDSPYARWFIASADDEFPVPSRLRFEDGHGVVELIGCWRQGVHARVRGAGSGRIWAKYAVLDVEHDVDYRRVGGLRTEVPGLRTWLGLRNWSQVFDPANGRRATIVREGREALVIGREDEGDVHLVFEPRSGWGSSARSWTLEDDFWCTTSTAEPATWTKHLEVHGSIRDLVILSGWAPQSCIPSHVQHPGDPELTYGDTVIGPSWRPVASARSAASDTSPRRPSRQLIPYADLGSAGVQRWLKLQRDFGRAIGPVVTSVDLGVGPTSALAHLGPGPEALGYLLDIEDGTPESSARNRTLLWRLGRILNEVGDVVPFEGDSWAEAFVTTYNGIKHANRALPEEADILNAINGAVLVVRAWVAHRLGVKPEHISQTLAMDRLNVRYHKLDEL